MTVPAFDTAISMLGRSKDPQAEILRSSVFWIPLQFVYVNMIRNKDITRLSDLPKERKLHYWMQTDRNWDKWKRICVCQALYVWDEIKNEI